VGHPIFAAFYERLARAAERGFMGPVRRELVGPAAGRVIEIGAGTGLSFAHYGDAAERVVAIEPDPHMLARAEERAAERGDGLVELRQLDAERLPFADGSFDTAIASLVLCSVASPPAALAELRRVLRPGGTLRFYEHVRSESALGARGQDAVAPLWRRLAGGCHPNRDTVAEIERAGFRVTALRRTSVGPPVPPTAVVRPHVIGVAEAGREAG
jgi:ubiquinone/menaquinone biosynthesis C-methylase UbiE